MKYFLYILGFLIFTSCSSSKDLVYYQVTLETGDVKPSDILLKPLYQKKDNQCGALFLEGKNLTVINNFDTSQTFINLKYKYEKNSVGLYDTYTFEDVFLKKKDNYFICSPIQRKLPVLQINGKKIKTFDKNIVVIEKENGSTVYIKKGNDAKGREFTEIYTVRKTILTSINYDKYSFPCE